MIKRIVISAVVALGASILLACLLGVLIQTETVDLKMAKTLSSILSALVLFAVCYAAAKTAPQGRMQVSLGTAAAYGVGLVALKLMLPSQMPWNVDWRLGLLVAAAVLAGVLSGMKKQRRRAF